MRLPKVKDVDISENEIDRILTQGLDQEGIIRMKSVDMAISFFKDKQVSDIKHFQKTYEDIYKFITNLEQNGTTTEGVR